MSRSYHKTVTPSELFGFLAKESHEFAGRIAVTSAQRSLTFPELYQEADRIAGLLCQSGIADKQLVVVCLANSAEFVPLVLALWKLSCKVALISPKYDKSELSAIVRATNPDALISQKLLSLGDSFTADQFDTNDLNLSGSSKMKIALRSPELTTHKSESDRSGAKLIREEDTALLKFTSGSTGEPKGIALSGRNILEEASNIVTSLNIGVEDHILAPVPLTHSYGFDVGVLSMLFAGCTLTIREMFIPRMAVADLANKQISIFLGVPSMYRFLVETPFTEIPDLHHLRYLLSCTAPLSGELIREFAAKFGCLICQHYGSSETGAVANHIPSEVSNRPASVGKALHGVEISIQDESGNEKEIGTEGEIVVRSTAVAKGYVMGQGPADDRLRDGTYRTGDSGLIDSDGFLHVLGRLDGVINVGGFKVWPGEVAAVLESHPAIKEAAVIGINDDAGGMIVGAAVTTRESISENEILKYCRARLADYKTPRRLKILQQLPVGPTGKTKLTPEDLMR